MSNTKVETAITQAMYEVEAMGADPKLTEAIILLGKAKELVADYLINKQSNISTEQL